MIYLRQAARLCPRMANLPHFLGDRLRNTIQRIWSQRSAPPSIDLPQGWDLLPTFQQLSPKEQDLVKTLPFFQCPFTPYEFMELLNQEATQYGRLPPSAEQISSINGRNLPLPTNPKPFLFQFANVRLDCKTTKGTDIIFYLTLTAEEGGGIVHLKINDIPIKSIEHRNARKTGRQPLEVFRDLVIEILKISPITPDDLKFFLSNTKAPYRFLDTEYRLQIVETLSLLTTSPNDPRDALSKLPHPAIEAAFSLWIENPLYAYLLFQIVLHSSGSNQFYLAFQTFQSLKETDQIHWLQDQSLSMRVPFNNHNFNIIYTTSKLPDLVEKAKHRHRFFEALSFLKTSDMKIIDPIIPTNDEIKIIHPPFIQSKQTPQLLSLPLIQIETALTLFSLPDSAKPLASLYKNSNVDLFNFCLALRSLRDPELFLFGFQSPPNLSIDRCLQEIFEWKTASMIF